MPQIAWLVVFQMLFQFEYFDPFDHFAAFWFTLRYLVAISSWVGYSFHRTFLN